MNTRSAGLESKMESRFERVDARFDNCLKVLSGENRWDKAVRDL
jgi:hypothetical protein